MNILITGGAGFIGSQVAKKLIQENHNIIIVDNFNDYYDPQLKEDRIKILLKGFNFKLYKIDISDIKRLKEVFTENKIDKIVHLAAQAGVRYSVENPFAYEQTNILGTLNVFELAKEFHIKQVVYASSSSVYGDNKKLPFSESDRTQTPLSFYAVSKIATEMIAYSYFRVHNVKSTGLRFFTVYGPWGRPDMALFLFTENILKNKPINIHNNGKMKRNWSYVDDIVNGTALALENIFDYEIFNLGNNESVELIKFVELIEKHLGKKAIREYIPIQTGEVLETQADLSKAKQMLNFSPQTTIESGIKNFINWYLDYYNK
jgi:UDP-glucuronate 4-epimerase